MLRPDNNKVIFSNFYQLKFNPNKPFYIYTIQSNIEINQEDKEDFWKQMGKKINPTLKPLLSSTYFSNFETIYSPFKTATDITSLGQHELNGNKYDLSLNQKGIISQSKPELIQLLGRLFKKMNFHIKLQAIGRKFFDSKLKTEFRDLKLCVFPGYASNVNQLPDKLLITIDSCFKVVRTEYMIDIIRNAYQNNTLEDLKGQTVMTPYTGKFYRVDSIDTSKNPKSTFQDKNGKEFTYMEYYKQKYNIQIKDPQQPLIKVIEKRGRQKQEQVMFLIPELCQPTGLTDDMRNNFQTMKQLATITKPNVSQRIEQSFKYLDRLIEDNKQVINQWNIQVERTPAQTKQQIIDPGSLLMDNKNKEINIKTANLDRDTQTIQYEQKQLKTWAIVYEKRDEHIFQDFLRVIQRSIGNNKFTCNAPKCIAVNDGRNEKSWIDTLNGFPKDITINLVVLILPGRKKQGMHYDAIKRFLIKDFPIPSQVILGSTIQQSMKGGDGKLLTICNKLLVQINAKLGGIPWSISNMPFTEKPTMIIGIDVYHQTKMDKNSVLAFVATMDSAFSKYYSTAQIHGVGEEFGKHLYMAMKQALEEFKKMNNIYPQNVIIFRDGVSLSQQSAVKELEVVHIRQALKDIPECANTTKLIVITANKKVNARFYLGNNLMQSENPQQGTVIDQDLTSGANDYYIISQRTTQGTASPTHYHILINDLENDKDIKQKLEIMTYKFCYLYCNFTGAIKVPAPIQYAHVLSNFIGDRYNPKRPEMAIIPHNEFIKKKCLYFV